MSVLVEHPGTELRGASKGRQVGRGRAHGNGRGDDPPDAILGEAPGTLTRWSPFKSSTSLLRDELLNGEIFYSLQEAKVLIEQWRREYNTVRPHSSLGYLPPAPEAIRPDPKLLNLPLLLGPRPRQNEAVGLTL